MFFQWGPHSFWPASPLQVDLENRTTATFKLCSNRQNLTARYSSKVFWSASITQVKSSKNAVWGRVAVENDAKKKIAKANDTAVVRQVVADNLVLVVISLRTGTLILLDSLIFHGFLFFSLTLAPSLPLLEDRSLRTPHKNRNHRARKVEWVSNRTIYCLFCIRRKSVIISKHDHHSSCERKWKKKVIRSIKVHCFTPKVVKESCP